MASALPEPTPVLVGELARPLPARSHDVVDQPVTEALHHGIAHGIAGLLAGNPTPTDDEIDAAVADAKAVDRNSPPPTEIDT